jgi:hypothetical protein
VVSDNPFDKACRHLLRRSGTPLLCWLLRVAPEALAFVRWLDTRLTLPDSPERVGDTIAHVRRLDQGGVPWAVPIEFQTEADARMFGRLLVYEGLLWLLEKPTDLPGDRFEMQSAVVNLTGVGRTARRMVWGEGAGTSLEPSEWDLETLDAGTILDQITAEQAPRALLVWIPLMKRGAEAAIMQRWLEIAAKETDPQWRSDLALAVLFAELTGCQDAWRRALEGFNVRKSVVVSQWQAEARAEGLAEGLAEGRAEGQAAGRAEALRDVLTARFGDLPADLAAKLTEPHTLDVLRNWTILAGRTGTLEQFRQEAGV